MTDDLVQRLRADVFYGDARLANMDKHNPLHMDAADCIEAQAAKIERLQRSADSWEADALRYAQNAEYWKAELMEARWLEIREKGQ